MLNQGGYSANFRSEYSARIFARSLNEEILYKVISDELKRILDSKIENSSALMLQVRALVKVDGYRATLPLPKANTNIIKRNDYYLARLFNNRIETLHSYIIISGLIVE